MPKDKIIRVSQVTYRCLTGISHREFKLDTLTELVNMFLDAYDKSNDSSIHYTRY